MGDGRPGVLVCACRADGRIVYSAPYDSEDVRIQTRRARRITALDRASNKPGEKKGGREDGKYAGQDVR